MVQRQFAKPVLDRHQPGEVGPGAGPELARRRPEIQVTLRPPVIQQSPVGRRQPPASSEGRFDDRLQPGIVEGDLMQPTVRPAAARKRMRAMGGPESSEGGCPG